jgi:hypothetical protein
MRIFKFFIPAFYLSALISAAGVANPRPGSSTTLPVPAKLAETRPNIPRIPDKCKAVAIKIRSLGLSAMTAGSTFMLTRSTCRIVTGRGDAELKSCSELARAVGVIIFVALGSLSIYENWSTVWNVSKDEPTLEDELDM